MDYEITIVNCMSARVSEGLLNILGGGWLELETPSEPFAVAGFVTAPLPPLPGSYMTLTFELFASDGEIVCQETGPGHPVREWRFDVVIAVPASPERPFSNSRAPFAMSFPPVAFPPNEMYHWKVSVDGALVANHITAFTTYEKPPPRLSFRPS